MVLLDLAGALLCLYGALAPATPESPVTGNAVAGVLAVAFAALVAAWLPVAIACTVGTELMGWLRASMRRLAATDPLTGLPNRAGFEHDADRELAIARRAGTPRGPRGRRPRRVQGRH